MTLPAAPRFLRATATARRFAGARNNVQRWRSPDPGEVASFQLDRLLAVRADVVKNVPYYQRLVANGAAPRAIESLTQFRSGVPLLRREDVIAAPELFVRTDRFPDAFMTTAGSTGNPLRFGVYRQESEPPASDMLTARIANGLEEGDRVFLLWGHSHLLGTGLRGLGKHGVRTIKDWVLGYRRANAYRLDPSSARSHMHAILSFRPHVLIAYSNALDLLVRHNHELRADARALGLRFVVATAEVLPSPDTRLIVEDFFGCPLAMEYGGVEFAAVAHTDSDGLYRVYWWNVLVEAVVESAAEETQIAVTALYPRCFPIVRYLPGDELGGVHRLPEGSVIAFDEMRGRHNDVVRLEDGTVIHSVALFHSIHQEPGVYNIQLVLEPGTIRIVLVAADRDPARLARIRHRLRSLSPALAAAPIEVVADLVTNRAGKRRWIVDRRGENTPAVRGPA